MWIMDQNKHTIFDIAGTVIGVSNKTVMLADETNGRLKLGSYESEEIALKVLKTIFENVDYGEKTYTMPPRDFSNK